MAQQLVAAQEVSMFGAQEENDKTIRDFVTRQRVKLANAWNLVGGDTVRADMECDRERLRDLLRQLPEGRDLEPTGSDLDEYEHRLDLCGEWDLVPAERWRLDSFIYAMARIEIERRLKVHRAKPKRRQRRGEGAQAPRGARVGICESSQVAGGQ